MGQRVKLPIVWSDEAKRNFREIISYIKRDSSQAAIQLAGKIKQGTTRLEYFPESGRKVPELLDEDPPPREILLGNYRVIYRIHSDRVEIIAAIHGRRLLVRGKER